MTVPFGAEMAVFWQIYVDICLYIYIYIYTYPHACVFVYKCIRASVSEGIRLLFLSLLCFS